MGDDPVHDGFIDRLKKSERARWYVAQWLSSWGYPVTLPPNRCAPSAKEWKEYVDQGDIQVGFVVEAKQRPRIHFTCAQDFPFDSIIVCGRNAFDRADPKPFFHVILNDTMTHAGIVYSNSAEKWWVKRLKCAETGLIQDFYLAPLDSVEFIPMEFRKEV